jgi:hypothetical protein
LCPQANRSRSPTWSSFSNFYLPEGTVLDEPRNNISIGIAELTPLSAVLNLLATRLPSFYPPGQHLNAVNKLRRDCAMTCPAEV